MLGALVFVSVPELVHIDPVSTQIFYGAALIAIVLVSPAGLVPRIADACVGAWRAWRMRKKRSAPENIAP